jgi:hypothetical protein
MTGDKKQRLGEALQQLAEALPPHLQEKFARDVVKTIGTDKVATMLMGAIMSNDEVFQDSVAEVKKLGSRGDDMLAHCGPFIQDLRDHGKDFHECWAAMIMMLSISTNSNALVEMLGYALTWIAFNGQVPPTPDTPESAAAKATAARKVADEFLDLGKLADFMRDERL